MIYIQELVSAIIHFSFLDFLIIKMKTDYIV
jgi:hypothetical protein